jgi:hypothetical protein
MRSYQRRQHQPLNLPRLLYKFTAVNRLSYRGKLFALAG